MKNLVLTDEQYTALLPFVKSALANKELPVDTAPLSLIILCENDFPVGIYTTKERCDLAAWLAIRHRAACRRIDEPETIFHSRSFIVNAEATI